MKKIRWPFVSQKRDDEMSQEMAFHIESTTRELVRAGMSKTDAQLEARRRFGSVLKQKEAGHEIRVGRIFEDIFRDARFMSRGLRRSAGFTIAVVLTLALGIGANTAIFSVVDQLLLRPLPYPEGDNLLMVYESGLGGRGVSFGDRNVSSPANWLDWQKENRTLEGLAAWRTASVTLTGAGEATRLNGQMVSSEFFPLLRVRPLLGRTISDEDDRPNAPLVAVMSHRLWQSRFGSDPNIIGRFIHLNDQPYQVVGVMPAGFRFVYQDNDLWGAGRLNRNEAWRKTSGRFINVMGRMKAGTTIDEARSDLKRIAQRLASVHEFNKNTSVNVISLREDLTGQVQTSLVVLYIAVGVLLSIACFNIANLLLARAASRRHEIAVRSSLGAGRLAIVRQLLVESVLLALAGGALGIVLARWSLDALLAFAPPDLLGVPELTIDTRVLLYTVGLSLLTGIVAGLAPAATVARRSILASLRTTSPRVTQSPRIRQALVVGQVAMTVVLLCGAGLLVRTVIALNNVNNGFNKHNLVTMEVGLPGARYPGERRVAFFRDTLATIEALPGVESAAASNSLAVIGSPRGGSWFHRRGTPELPPSQRPTARIRVVTPEYFRTLRIPLRRGREFTRADEANPAPGFIVNEAFAREYLSGVDPLTESITVWMQAENPYAPIIGVVGDVSEGSVRDNPQPTIFYNHSQMREARMMLVARSDRPAATAEAAVSAIRRIDPNLPVTKIGTFEGALAESLAQERLSALVSGAFALSGLLLAALGLYALLAFLVTERTREIGLRIALGAQGAELTWSVVKDGLRLVFIGAAAGVALSLVMMPWFGALLFGVTPNDVATYAVVLTLLAAVAGLASYVPARRAARVEPLTALRQE
jgi:putative ABC transport system permease protein